MLKNKLNIIIITSFLLKLAFVFFVHEKNLSDEWIILFNNFQENNSYSYYIFDGIHVPSSYMPPLYFIFLYLNKILSFNLVNFLYLVFLNQILLSTMSVYLFYKICKNFFNDKNSLIGALIFSLFPLMIYSNGLVSSASLQIFLYLLFFNYYLVFLEGKVDTIGIFKLSVICALNLILRGEFIIIFFFSIFYFILINKKKALSGITVLILAIGLISPYIIRNFDNTNKLHIVNSSGYALWKGNNSLANVEGFHNSLNPETRTSWPDVNEFKTLYNELDKIEKNELYEVKRDEVFKKEAFKNISSNKIKYFILYLKKVFSFYLIDFNSSVKNYYNSFHIIPILIFGILSIPGIIIAYKERNNFKIKYLIWITLILTCFISIFFILPRYKISIISFQILFSIYCLDYLKKKKM